MNAEQAIRLVRKVRPGTYASVDVATTLYATREDSDPVQVRYRLSIQPGIDGQPCQGFNGESVQECVEKFQEGIVMLMEQPVEDDSPADGQCEEIDSDECTPEEKAEFLNRYIKGHIS